MRKDHPDRFVDSDLEPLVEAHEIEWPDRSPHGVGDLTARCCCGKWNHTILSPKDGAGARERLKRIFDAHVQEASSIQESANAFRAVGFRADRTHDFEKVHAPGQGAGRSVHPRDRDRVDLTIVHIRTGEAFDHPLGWTKSKSPPPGAIQ